MFVASLKKEVKNALIQKNIILRNNDEVEKADSSYLYINIVISDSLFLSAKKLSNNDVYVAESRSFILSSRTWFGISFFSLF